MEQYKRGLETETTQTEVVVILGPNEVLLPLTSNAFQNIMELLKDLKKGQLDMKVQVEELKKEQREIKSKVQDLTREVAAEGKAIEEKFGWKSPDDKRTA